MESTTAQASLAAVGGTRRRALALLALTLITLPRISAAVPSFASQTGMPCSQCHVVAFGVALTAYGRQFKLNGYTYTGGEHAMPLAAPVDGPGSVNVNASLIHEKQQLDATFAAGGANNATNHQRGRSHAQALGTAVSEGNGPRLGTGEGLRPLGHRQRRACRRARARLPARA